MVNIFELLGGGFNSFMMDVVVWGIIIIGLILGVWYWIVRKMLYKYVFVEVDNMGNYWIRKAKIGRNKNRIKKFMLKNYNTPEHYLSIKETNGILNGKPVRFIAWDGQGNLAYCDKIRVDKELYLQTALVEVERTEAVDGQMEAIEKSDFLSTAQKWVFTGLITMFVFMIIGLIMVSKYGFEQAGTISEGGHMFKQASDNFLEGAKILEANTIANENLVRAIVKDANLSLEQEIGTT